MGNGEEKETGWKPVLPEYSLIARPIRIQELAIFMEDLAVGADLDRQDHAGSGLSSTQGTVISTSI